MWVSCLIALMTISITYFVYRWRNPRCNGKLPPGSMGFPILGESIEFFTPTSSHDIPPFVKKRMERYGPIFCTNLVTQPIIVSTDPELNYLIFQEEGQLFQSWYPKTFTEIFGRQNASVLHGPMFKYLKNMVLNLFGPENLKRMLAEVEQASFQGIKTWSDRGIIDAKDSIATLIFGLTAKKLISYDQERSSVNLRDCFVAFMEGLISFPLDIPGTAYNKCLQGRKTAIRVLKKVLEERKANRREETIDFFDYVIGEMKKEGSMLTEEIALDLMFVLLFASHETTSTAITCSIKNLSDHPHVLHKLTEEHKEILRKRENPNSGLTWEEYKSMKFTFQFINETLRLANIAPGMFRKAIKDVKFKGYTIPAGWPVMVNTPAVHLNPTRHDDPLAFNPWRWEGQDMYGASKNFMVFGGGIRLCVGADFNKLQMAVFLHCLVTNFRWETIKGGNLVRNPGVQFPAGYHLRIMEKQVIKT